MQKDIKNISNEDYPQISIVTVCFNSAKTIEQTILSVINQTYSSIEYIIIDGKSTDGTVDIIEKYQDKIAYFVSEPDGGIYDAMNKGINRATGDYIYFIGSDDYLVDEEIMSVVANYLKEDRNVDILSGGVWVVDEEQGLKKQNNPKPLMSEILKGTMLPHQGMFVRTNLMRLNMFNVEYKIAADFDFLIKCVKNNCQIKYINDFIAYYSDQGFSTSSGIDCQLEYKKILLNNNLLKDNIYMFNKKIIVAFLKIKTKIVAKKMGVWKRIGRKRGWIESITGV